MALKFTKVTQHPCTNQPSVNMGPAKSIEKPLPGSKSSFCGKDKAHWTHRRGMKSEVCVKKFFEAKGFELIHQRFKTPFAEIDLIFKSSSGNLLIVEVKSLSNQNFLEFRISESQKTRLRRAIIHLTDLMNCKVSLNWAFVSANGEVLIRDDIWC